MIGLLPQTLKVCNKDYAIRSDFRNILTIIMAYNDKDLSNEEKVFVCLHRIYKDLESMPRNKETYAAAIQAATEFIECRMTDGKPSPKVVNWEKDEQLIFPAINKVAGTEVRALQYMHWWTFLGYFQAIDRDDLWGAALRLLNAPQCTARAAVRPWAWPTAACSPRRTSSGCRRSRPARSSRSG